MLEHPNVEGGFWHRLSALEPAVIRGVLVSVFAVIALFGVEWATETNALTLVTALTAITPLIAGLLIRPTVTPNAKTGAERSTSGGFEAGAAAPYPEGTPVEVVLEDSPKSEE